MTLFALLPVAGTVVALACRLVSRAMRRDRAYVRAELFELIGRVFAIAAGVSLGLLWGVR